MHQRCKKSRVNIWWSLLSVYDRLSSESERSTMYECEVSGLKEQLTSRDRVVIELNTELERVQQQITQLNNSYQTAQQQAQHAQRAMYVTYFIHLHFVT